MPAGDELRYRSRSGCFHLAGAGELKVARLQARDHRRPILGQLGSNGRRSRKGLCRRSTMADRAARRQRLAKKNFDAIRTAHPRDRSAARVYRPFLGWGWTAASARLSMDEGIRCQKTATSIFSPARERSPSPKFTDERSLRTSFDQP